MWRLVKTELHYNAFYLLMILFLPLLLSVGLRFGLKPLTGVDFFQKNVWTIMVGLGAYVFIFIIWQLRRSELRVRIHTILPVSRKELAFSHTLFFISPFILALGLLHLVHVLWTIPEYHFYLLLKQLGTLFVVLSFIQLILEIWFTNTKREKSIHFLITGLIGCMLIFISIYSVFKVLMPLCSHYFKVGEGVAFFLWGAILLSLSALIFTKRKSYLE